MKVARLFVLLAALVLLLAAGCGGGGGTAKLGSNDIAVVGSSHITRTQFDDAMGQAKRSFKAHKRPFPKPGTAEYNSLKQQAVQYLVQQTEIQAKAKDLGIDVTDKDIDKKLKGIKKQYFGGSEARYKQGLKAQGLTEKDVRNDVKSQLISDAISKKVTKDIKVTDKDVRKYYDQNKTQYGQPESRDVRHILVKTRALADKIYGQLRAGGDFAKLAKKYSQDPGSKALGGKLTVSKGQTVPQFDQVAFQLEKGQLSHPIHTQYGWHIIQALSAVHPAKATPFKSVKSQISQQLLQQKKQQKVAKWLDDMKKSYVKKTKYQEGYKPPQTQAAPTTT
jgi:parvulin-like peptidyl-prolyl isomerase